MSLRILSLVLVFTALVSAQQVEPFKGYLDIPWGSTEVTVKQKALGELVHEGHFNAYDKNNSLDAKYAEYTLAPPARMLVFHNKHGEVTTYYLCGNKLCLVDIKPANPIAFNPIQLVANLEKLYGNQTKMVKRKHLAPPYLKIKFDPKTEYLLTTEWNHDEGLVRAAIKTWPREDMRQVYRVFYTSKPLIEANKRRLVEIVQEKEEARKQAEEEARKAKEAAAAAAAAAP